MAAEWSNWMDSALEHLGHYKLLRSLRPLSADGKLGDAKVRVFDRPGPWDRQAVEMRVSGNTHRRWMQDTPSTGDEVVLDSEMHKLILFSGNDYLGLSAHPAVRAAAAEAAWEFGMGPRGSPLICGYTHHHRLLESALADLKNTEECLLCPTGFAANMAVMSALCMAIPELHGSNQNRIAIFSDALNHASIIDGVRVAQRQSNAEVYVYQHNDMIHLENLLSDCKLERKVVVSDSLFSMDGDFAHMEKLVALREKHKFLLVIDDAHGTLVCGENGGGMAEACGVEGGIDIFVGTLSKAFGCHGGFVATSRKWKQLIQSRGRAFVFSTSLPVPVVAAAHAAILVAREEKWRRQALWNRVKQFSELTGLPAQSPIVPIIIGGAEETLLASKHLLEAGFHVTAIRPPTVPENSSRLRVTLCAAHTAEDVDSFYRALSPWLRKLGAKSEHEASIETKIRPKL